MNKKKSNQNLAPLWGFNDDFGNLFEGFFRPMRGVTPTETGGGRMPAVDVVETDKEYKVKVDIPGVEKDDIKVSVDGDVLTINAETEKSEEKKDEEGRVMRQERYFGSYVRSMHLGGIIDENKIKANYKNGVLNLVLPKLTKAKPKKIAVDIR